MKLLFTLFFSLLITNGFSQDYLDHITDETCDCLGDIDKIDDYEEFTMALGLCMIKEAEPYKKKLKRDFNINFNNLEETGLILGEQIGIRLVGSCPDFLEAFSKFDEEVLEEISDDDESAPSPMENKESSVKGIIESHTENGFLSIRIETTNGELIKLHWLEYVDSDFNLDSDLSELDGLKVEAVYIEKELYDIRSNEYRYYKVLRSLKILD